MMDEIADYRLAPPPSGEDITGNILPVADMDGADAALRKEDYYYIRELWSAFMNSGSAYTNSFSEYQFRTLVNSIINNTNNWKTEGAFYGHHHLKAGLSSYSFEGTLVTGQMSATWYNQFFNWMKDNDALQLLDAPASSMSAGAFFLPDIVRLMYYSLAKPSFRQVHVGASNKHPFTYTIQQTTFPYTYVTLAANKDVVVNSAEGTICAYGSGIGITGGDNIGMRVLSKYDGDLGKTLYYNSLAFPSSAVSANVTFNAPVSDAYAVVNLNLSRGSSQGRQLLRRMTGSGTNWSVELVKREDYNSVTTNLAVPALDQWGEVSATATWFHPTVYAIFAKFTDPYFALPSGWNWSPS